MHRFTAFWVNLRSSLWFVPSVIAMSAIVLGLVMVEMGRIDALSQASLPRLFGFSAEGSRAMLSAIASSMITVAGVAFSITIVALSLTSSQYSPRVLRHFMRDRGNQSVLGVFVGIFAYCLVVLPMVRGGEEHGYVPALAVAFGVMLALVGVGCLIYFIHHVATSIQASSIVSAIADETHRAIGELFPDTLGKPAEPPPQELENMQWTELPAPTTGYLQLVNETALLNSAASHDVILRMENPIGAFILSGTPLVSVNGSKAPDAEFVDEVASAFTINRTRTVEQDAAFGFRQIVDVALRALSPSINDTTTAVLCINHLTDLLRHAAARHDGSPYRRHEGKLCVIARRADFEDFVHLAFDQICEHGAANHAIVARLFWAIEKISEKTLAPDRSVFLANAARSIGEAAQREIKDPAARTQLVQQAQRLARTCLRSEP